MSRFVSDMGQRKLSDPVTGEFLHWAYCPITGRNIVRYSDGVRDDSGASPGLLLANFIAETLPHQVAHQLEIKDRAEKSAVFYQARSRKRAWRR